MIVENQNTTCIHCDLPVPTGLLVADDDEQFCCSGCRCAYQLIHGNGLDSFYDMLERDQIFPVGRQATEVDFTEFDRSSFLSRFAKQTSNDELEVTLALDGIHCAACIWLIEKLPRIVNGVLSTQLSWAKQTARIRWQPSIVSLSQIARTLSQLGYRPHPIRLNENELRRKLENRRHLIRIGVAGAAAGNNMLIATALYLGMFSQMGAGVTTLLRIVSCLIGLVALLGPGRVFLRGALSALRTRTPHMDLPIALGLGVGTVAGFVNTLRGVGEIYFDSLSVLVFFLLIGRWLQFRQQNRAADSVEMLYRLTPRRARKIIDGKVVETFVDAVEVGDLLEIRAGDIVPVDGTIIEGMAEFDEAILTGESRPAPKFIGDSVLAGTKNCDSVVSIRAISTERDTRLSAIVDLVEEASLQKPQAVQWANRIGGYFVSVVLLLAAVTLSTWLWFDPAVAIDRTVALLIVACPCALALATPLAISVALGRAARNRIMVKGGDVLQALDHPGMIWLDKTGTLTEGEMLVAQWYGNTSWKDMVAKLESKSSHPVAKAIVTHAKNDTAGSYHPLPMFGKVTELEGRGIRAQLMDREFLVGNESLLREHNIQISRHHQKIAERILGQGYSPCWIAVDQSVNAILAIGDQIRPETGQAIADLKSSGWRIGILSGDHPSIVGRVAKRLGIDADLAKGAMTPEEKVSVVRASKHRTVVMVGDGVNDSAALAAATVGIAVSGGAEASLESAPVYLANEGLAPVLQLLAISQSTNRVMRRNLAISLTYNIAGATLAFLGYINPLVAAILMPISSLSVVAMSMTAGRAAAKGNNLINKEAERESQ